MYLFNNRTPYRVLWCGGLLLAASIYGCKPDIKENGANQRYFDLKKFISADSARLAKSNVSVVKTVIHNGSDAQTKTIHISNWGRELSLFAESDINKPAWRESYTVTINGDSTIYAALDPKLKTRRVVITIQNSVLHKIRIVNATSNLLFHSSETLTYVPDSLYEIHKQQQVKLLGNNTYVIKGLFAKK